MTDYRPLKTFLQQLKSDDSVCALETDHTPRSCKQWNHRFYQWRQHLAKQELHRWALYHEDCFEFSAILFALWSLNKKVYLPGNNQPGHIDNLSRHVDGLVGSIEDQKTISAPENSNPETVSPWTAESYGPLRMEEELLYVFTSGSSGAPQAIGKTLAQIGAELDTLHQQWGRELRDVHVLSSVSHQHIYGLLFRCLWPLLEGWSFDTHAKQYTETFCAPKNRRGLLVSSPTHLSRLPQESLNLPLSMVFSSGAPLDFGSSQHAKQHFQCPATEVLGSSETGGIAWRQQKTPTDSPWTTFDCVDIDISNVDHQLSVRSPYLRNATQWFKSNDSAKRVNDNQFILAGRVDRIIKLEGKRLSLDEMEAQLKQHPLVNDAHIVALDQNRIRLGAIVCIHTPPSENDMAERRALTKQLKAHLLTHFERPTLPKKWRYMNSLPKNSQGKLSHQEMNELFEKNQKRPTLPTVLSTEKIDDTVRLSLKVPEDLLYFDGHFDQSPILPGVVQLQWAEEYAREHFQLTGDFMRLEALKFQKIATPGIFLTLDLSFSEKNKKIVFKYTSSIGQHASGRIVLAP